MTLVQVLTILGVPSLISASVTGLIVFLNNRRKKNAADDEAVRAGVQALLRESIVDNYNKYTDRGYCPIYAKESIKRVYAAYHDLDGNDVATGLYHKLLDMPEEPKEKEDSK